MRGPPLVAELDETSPGHASASAPRVWSPATLSLRPTQPTWYTCYVIGRFIGRGRELASLERMWNARGGQLVLVWGRRRVGKSFLLSRFADGRRSIYFTGTERSADVELAAFSEA